VGSFLSDSWRFQEISNAVLSSKVFRIRGRRIPSLQHKLVGLCHSIEEAAFHVHPQLSCDDLKHFWQSWQVRQLIAKFAFKLGLEAKTVAPELSSGNSSLPVVLHPLAVEDVWVWCCKELEHYLEHLLLSPGETNHEAVGSDQRRHSPQRGRAEGVTSGSSPNDADGVATDRRRQVDDFIQETKDKTGKKITRKDIWQAAGYKDPTEFQRWQRDDRRQTATAAQNIQRALSEKPGLT